MSDCGICKDCGLPIMEDTVDRCPECGSMKIIIDPERSKRGYYLWRCEKCRSKWCS